MTPPQPQLFSLPIHSSIDLITNSSSELFMLESGKTLQSVRSMMTGLVSMWKGRPTSFGEAGMSDDLTLYNINWNPPPEYYARTKMLTTESGSFGYERYVGKWEYLEEAQAIGRFLEQYRPPTADEPARAASHITKYMEEETIQQYMDRVRPIFVESLRALLSPATTYLTEWWPGLTADRALHILLDGSWSSKLHLLLPGAYEAIVIHGNSYWRWPEENNPSEAFCARLVELGFPDAGTGYFSVRYQEPMVGQHVAWTSVEDNSVPYELMKFMSKTLPIRSWHLG
jgi:hypothetical protein